MVTHRILEGDVLSEVLTAANLPQAQPGQTVYRLMDDGSYQVQVVAADLSLSTVLSLPQSVLEVLPRFVDADGTLSYDGRAIEGLTPEQVDFLAGSIAGIDALDARLAALENVEPEPSVPTIEVLIPPRLIDSRPVPAGTTFQQFLDQWIDKGFARVVGGEDDEFQYQVQYLFDPISTGTDPMQPGDVVSGLRRAYGAEGLQTIELPVVQFVAKVPLITTDLVNEVFVVTEGETLTSSGVVATITDATRYRSNVGDVILQDPTIETGAEDFTSPLLPGEVPISIFATDTANSAPQEFVYRVLVNEAPIVPVIDVTQAPTLLEIEDGFVLSTAVGPYAAAIDGTPVAPEITYNLNDVAATGDEIVSAGDDFSILFVFEEGEAEPVEFLLAGTVKAAVVVDTGTSASSMSYDGATAFFSAPRQTGTYADGSTWASSNDGADPVSIEEISPASASGVVRTVGTSTTTGPTVVNGAHLNPGKAPSGSTLAARQSVNDGADAVRDRQPYDSFFATNNLGFDGSKNVDPGATGQPLVLTEGTICKAISKLTSVNSQARPPLVKMVPFTIVRTPPLVGSFRPGHADPSKASWLTIADLDMSKLPNLAAGGLAIPSFATEYAKTTKFLTWQHTYNANSRNILSPDGRGWVYGGSRDEWMGAILAMCYDVWTPTQKEQIARAFVQIAIDITARVEQGGVFQENGGHSVGQKAIVALAAHLTGHPRFVGALGATTTLFSWQGGAPYVWAEDRQIFRISLADVSRRQKYQFNYPNSMLGVAEWSSDATRDNPDGPSNFRERLNTLGVDTSAAAEDLKQSYRHIVANVNVPAALALRMMGADYLMTSRWLDYQDRHMAARIARGSALPDGQNNDIKSWVLAAWVKDRAAAGTNTDTGGTTQPNPPPVDPPPPDPEPVEPPVIDNNTPAIVGSMGQSDMAYTTEAGTNYSKTPYPTVPSRVKFTMYQSQRSEDTTGGVVKTVLTNGNKTAMNVAMVRLALALDYITPGKPYVFAEWHESGSSLHSLVDDANTGSGSYDVTKDRLWSHFAATLGALENDYPQGLSRFYVYWYASTAGDMPKWLERYAPAFFGQYEDGSPFTLGSLNPDPADGRRVHHCFYDFESSGPTVKGRGVFKRTVPMDFGRMEAYVGTKSGAMDGMREFSEDSRFEALGGRYGLMAPGGHGSVTALTGTVEAAYQFHMATMLRAAGIQVEEPYFEKAYTAADGSYVDITMKNVNGGALQTRNLYSGNPISTTADRAQEIFGFEIAPAAGGGRYWILRNGATSFPEKYRGTVKRLNSKTVRFTPLVPIAENDSLTYMKGTAYHRKDGVFVAADISGNRSNVANEMVSQFTDPSSDFPFLGFPVRTYEDGFVLKRGQTVTTTGPIPDYSTPPPVEPPAPGAPTVTTAPVLSGTPEAGQTLTLTAGSFTGSPTLSRQLTVNGTPSGSATTALTFAVPSGLTAGDLIRVVTTATNASGSVMSTSNSLAYVAAAGGAPTTFFTTSSTGPTFTSADVMPSGVYRVRHRFIVRPVAVTTSRFGNNFLRIEATNFDFELAQFVSGNNRLNLLAIKDGAGSTLSLAGGVNNQFQNFPAGQWAEVEVDGDLSQNTITGRVVGQPDVVKTLNSVGTGFFVAGARVVAYNGNEGITTKSVGTGVSIALMETYFNGSSTPFFSISGNAATVNASPRKTPASGNAT